MPKDAGHLLEEVRKVAPALNASIGKRGDRNTWKVELSPTATQGQIVLAQQVIDQFDIEGEPPDVALQNRMKINELIQVVNKQPGVRIELLSLDAWQRAGF
jgi:hypothetical protein